MYSEGDYIIQRQNGLCRVEAVTTLDFSETDKNRLYYKLSPLENHGTIVFVPVDKSSGTSRHIMNEEEAKTLIDGMPSIEAFRIPGERLREQFYREAVLSIDCHDWVKLIKTLYLHRQERLKEGKKITGIEDHYYKKAECRLYGELAFALNMDKEDMESYIINQIEDRQKVTETE